MVKYYALTSIPPSLGPSVTVHDVILSFTLTRYSVHHSICVTFSPLVLVFWYSPEMKERTMSFSVVYS